MGITMAELNPQIRFSSALIKVASRCNLNCDYCYVYQHADQSWRTQPRFVSDETVDAFARRLHEYVRLHGLTEFSVTFHGGEPLLIGVERLIKISKRIRNLVASSCTLEFSVQTNATLLNESVVAKLEEAAILVSLSLDGPRFVNDRHRVDHSGRSSFDAVLAALASLKGRSIFQGVIAVIDPSVKARDLFTFFNGLALPRLDLLLPDATYERPPEGRAEDPDRYVRWLQEAFELWFREFSTIPIRWFDAILASRAGLPSPTDAMGLGSLSLIVLDTDGSYTDHDVFKITRAGPALGVALADTSFEELATHPSLRTHAHRLTLDGLAPECRSCPVVEACGGGSVMHRSHPERGLDAPTVYCRELLSVFELATRLLCESLPQNAARPQALALSGSALVSQCERFAAQGKNAALRCMEVTSPSANAEPPVPDVGSGGDHIRDAVTRWLGIRVHADVPELVKHVSDGVRVLARNSLGVQQGVTLLFEAEAILRSFDPHLPRTFSVLISDIIFVEAASVDDDQIISFSDEGIPNVLYVAPLAGGAPLTADDFADSLYHEFLHHVLYSYERSGRLVHDRNFPHFPAPWRAGLRTSSSFLHGTFVFANLARFWAFRAGHASTAAARAKADENAVRFRKQGLYGIDALRKFGLLTARGRALIEQLAAELDARERLGPEPAARAESA
jgi:uncharacterized protein